MLKDFGLDVFEDIHEISGSFMDAPLETDLVVDFEPDGRALIPHSIINGIVFSSLDMLAAFNDQLADKEVKERLRVTFLTKH